MKSAICLLLFFVLRLSLNANAQKVDRTKDDFPTYQGVVEAPGKDEKQLYGLLKEWIARNYNSAQNVIQSDDPENGRIVVKGLETYTTNGPLNVTIPNKAYHLLTLEVKAEKFRYTIEITDVTTGTADSPMMKPVLLSDPPIKPNGKPYTGSMLKTTLEQKETHLQIIDAKKERTIQSLTQLATSKKDDW